jgi:hypothetical protein
MKARKTLVDNATRPEDVDRLIAAFDIAWSAVEKRVGDEAAVSEKLAHLIVSLGNHRPELQPAELAKMAARMLEAPMDRD